MALRWGDVEGAGLDAQGNRQGHMALRWGDAEGAGLDAQGQGCGQIQEEEADVFDEKGNMHPQGGRLLL
jgi:hypothetical protein